MQIRAMIVIGLLLSGAKLACAESMRERWPVLGNEKDPDAIEQVVSGASEIASAAWWGFDAEDSTEFLQSAIDSGAKTVIVPYMGNPWVVRPINLRSNLTLLFEPGVVVLAKRGEFKGRDDSLFLAVDETDITLRGYGARFVMRKEDYQSDAYKKAEWRMGIRLLGCSNVTIEGIRIEKSGGDGIYVGAGKQPYCKNIVIRDVQCADNHRQGISVIGAENLLIENCTLSGTDGTPPQAGIDFEPNQAVNKMVNCVVRNCVMEDNTGPGILVYLSHLSGDSDPVSIRAENCFVRSGKGSGIAVSAVRDTGPEGAIEFENCTIERTQMEGIHVHAKSADRLRVRFLNCRCKDVCLKEGDPDEAGKDQPAPIQLTSDDPKVTTRHGGIDFVSCSVYDTVDRPALAFYDKGSGLGVHDLTGTITVYNPHGARMHIPCETSEMKLDVLGRDCR